MKKNILYLVALISVMFAACNPLKDEINNLKPVLENKTLAFTLATTDYALLPSSNYAQKSFYFATEQDANASIPVILNSRFPQLANGDKANITYNSLPAQIKPVDSVFATVQYTVTQSDYTDGAAVVGNGTFKTYSVAQATAFMEWKYPKATTPVNKLVLLTYQFFQSNATPSAGVAVTEAFLLLSAGWQKIYLVSPTQYASLGRGINNSFTSADVPSFSAYFNTLLKSDPNVVSPKVGEVKYVSYKYQQSATLIYQRVFMTIFDGTNWIIKSVPVGPLAFLKKNGTWIPDPTVYYTLIATDYTNIADNSPATIGNTANRANLKQFRNFNLATGQATSWAAADVDAAIIFVLNSKFSAAVADPTIVYNITITAYNGSSTGPVVKLYVKGATGFVVAPPTE